MVHAVAVIALALGIGVNATVFTFVNAVLIRGLPFDDPDRILLVASRDAQGPRPRRLVSPTSRTGAPRPRRSRRCRAFDGATMNVSDEGRAPERFSGPYISANAFSSIGQAPLLGRDFAPDDDRPGAAAVVMLGNGIWKNRYGGDPSVVGRTIKVNEVPAVVIGVMPEGFKFPTGGDLWMPLAQMPRLLEQKRDCAQHRRLRPPRRRRHDRAGAVRSWTRSRESSPATTPTPTRTSGAHVMTFNERVNGGPIKLVFLSLMGAVAFVLLIACANVANLLLARSAARAREMSVRIALGASRWRIVRQLLVESVLLSIISGVLGLALAYVGVRLFDAATQDVGKPYWIQFTMDGQVFAFFAAVCLGTGIVFGLAPALHVSKTDLNEVLKEGGRSGSSGMRARRWTSALIVAELALTLVLLAGAGLMMRSFLNLYRLDVGVETSQLLTMRLNLPNQKYPTPELRKIFYDRLDQRLAGLAGVQSATIVSNAPLNGGFPAPAGDGRPRDSEGRAGADGDASDGRPALLRDARHQGAARPRLRRPRRHAGTRHHDRQSALRGDAFRQHRSDRAPDQADRGRPAVAGGTAAEWVTVVGVAPTVRQIMQQGDDTPDRGRLHSAPRARAVVHHPADPCAARRRQR